MTKYLFIETRSSFEMHADASFADVIEALCTDKHLVTVFLVQNAVLDARAGAAAGERLRALANAGAEVLADAFSMRERAVSALANGIQRTDIDALVTRVMEPGTRAIWH